jgi:GNAT superfamily N-acetyltransferase/predicted GNAT family acetyltransferase
MVKWDAAAEICFAVAVEGGHLSGVLGCEYDEGLGRGWLWGPFVLSENWEDLAAALLAKLRTLLPLTIRRVDFFLNDANQRAYRFYLAQGFQETQVSHVYVAPPPREPIILVEPCGPLQPEQIASFRALHDAIFPHTYYSGQNIVDQLDGDHQVFVCGQEEVLGYIYAIIDESSEGYVEFLGVLASERGKGLGHRLLLSALSWLFQSKGVSEVGLTVSDDKANARSLYEKVGFRIKYSGLSARKEW